MSQNIARKRRQHTVPGIGHGVAGIFEWRLRFAGFCYHHIELLRKIVNPCITLFLTAIIKYS